MVDNRGPELQAVCAVFVSLAFVATLLRVYTRTFLVRAFGMDDAWMIIALLCHIMFTACAIAGARWGTGRHMVDLSNKQIFEAMRYWWLCYITYCLSMIAAKISIGLFLLRVTVSKIHRWIIFTVIGSTVLIGFIFFFVSLLQCTPISFFWNKALENGYCVPIDVIIGITFLYSAISVICDFTLAILPIFLVWDLNMSVKTRVVLVPVLGMACVAGVAVVVRMAFVMAFKNPDFLYATVDIAIWSDIELGLAITASSLATLRPLFRQVTAHFGLSTGSASQPSKPTGRHTPQWGPPASGNRQGFPSFPTLLRSKEGTVKIYDKEYTMGNLQPMRLGDSFAQGRMSEDSVKGFAWAVQTSQTSDEEHRAGTITVQKQVHQETERR